MKVLYRISTRTTENSNYKLHIPVVTINKPLCQQHEHDNALASYEYIEGKPTCKKCLKIWANLLEGKKARQCSLLF